MGTGGAAGAREPALKPGMELLYPYADIDVS